MLFSAVRPPGTVRNEDTCLKMRQFLGAPYGRPTADPANKPSVGPLAAVSGAYCAEMFIGTGALDSSRAVVAAILKI
jgi:hypothetical protein